MKMYVFFIICVLMFLTAPVTVSANGGQSSLAITVVIPDTEPVSEPEPSPTPTPNPVNYIYPVSVTETLENGRREIIKAYELGAGEKPGDISREAFIREGWLFELTDVVKKETATADEREHEETVTLNTESKDTEAVMKLLPPTFDYKSEDGYMGVLELDISTVKVETAGVRNESFTATAVREYPHLSGNDSSLVPKTITDGGRQYTLSNIEWRTQNSSTVDYAQLPDSYTAVAKYTRTGYKEIVTGYVTTAIYRGSISKVLSGKTVYTAYFIGVPIISATVGATAPEGAGAETSPVETAVTELPHTEAAELNSAETAEPTQAEAEAATITASVTTETAAELTPADTTAEVTESLKPKEADIGSALNSEPGTGQEATPDIEPERKLINVRGLLMVLSLIAAAICGGLIHKYCFYNQKKKKEDDEDDFKFEEDEDEDYQLEEYKFDEDEADGYKADEHKVDEEII
jgi:hypothetical protein